MTKKNDLIIHSNHSPTTFTDGVNIASRNDGCVLLQFVSETPDCFVENIRTIMTKEGIIEFIDSLCMITDYYPTKISDEEAKKKVKKLPRNQP